MAVNDLPLVSMLRTRMHWHQSRQKLLAENIANADTPGFTPKDLKPPSFGGASDARGLGVVRTDPAHLALGTGRPAQEVAAAGFETTPNRNGVNLEDEMLKVAQNQSDYQLAASLYQKSLQVLRLAVGKGGR
ncbi:MAG TPA: flagellar basal body rod protein FlgB [Beijerinckiaceae bacterium]|nr:flagellar basal body rod protein FlgB [Beijerinckiaceae bacterium]